MSYRKRPAGGSRSGPVTRVVRKWRAATARLEAFSVEWSRRYIEMQAEAFGDA